MRKIIGKIFAIGAFALLALVLGTLSAGAAETVVSGQRGTVWVANRGLHNITAFDGATGNVLATIAVGKEPNSLTIARGARKVYVSDEASNTISVVSITSRSVVKKIPVGSKPHHIQASWDGKRVYYGVYGTNKVGAIDTATDTLVGEWVTNANRATRTHAPWVARDGRTVWTTNEVANEIAALDTSTGQILYAIPIGNRPSEILVTPDGRTAYVSVRNENKVKQLDLSARTVVREAVVGTQPDTLQLTPDGKTLIVGLRGVPAQVAVVDTASFTVKPITIGGTATLAAHEWLSANGRYTFAAFEGEGAGVAVIDNRSNTVVATYAYPGGGRPHGLSYDDPAYIRPLVAVSSRELAVARKSVRVPVACEEATAGPCRGQVTLRGGGRDIGKGSFSIAAGESSSVSVPLAQPIRARVLYGRAFVRVSDALGNTAMLSWPITITSSR
jgi:YVTN family beta-propeller protein